MADDKGQTAADRQRISTEQDDERRDPTQNQGATEEKLREAFQAAGSSVNKVRAYLRSHGGPAWRSTHTL